MELTVAQETDVQKIMAETDCPKGFRCYESGVENLTPVKVIAGEVVEGVKAKESYCRMSFRFGLNMMICKCPLRKYVALELRR